MSIPIYGSDDAESRLNTGTLLARRLTLTVGKSVDDAAAMTAGWSRRQLVDAVLALAVAAHAYRAAPPQYSLGERLTPEEASWTDRELRAARNLTRAGDRSPDARDGDRIFHRLRTRRYRSVA